MDRRQLELGKDNYLFNALNSDDLNLELANNIEIMTELRELIKVKAVQSYSEQNENKRIFTMFSHQKHLEDNPRAIYILGFVVWFLAFKKGSNIKCLI